jgi:hypothetical protein
MGYFIPGEYLTAERYMHQVINSMVLHKQFISVERLHLKAERAYRFQINMCVIKYNVPHIKSGAGNYTLKFPIARGKWEKNYYNPLNFLSLKC